MAGMHHTRKARRLSVALVSAATATATALTVGVEPPPEPAKRLAAETVDLAAAIQLLPTHDQVPDITGGLGTTVYDASQAIADQLIRAVVNGINLSALAQAAGVDPKSLVNALLAEIPANLLPGIITQLGLQLPVLNSTLGQVQGITGLLTGILNAVGIPELTSQTLTGLLAVLGLNLSDPLNLSNLTDDLGINIVTSGSPFALLKMLGLDLGWTPALPNSVAAEINGSPYLQLGAVGVLNLVLKKLKTAAAQNNLLQPLVDTLTGVIGGLTAGLPLPDILDLRIVPTVGVGLGAFAAAMAYQKVIDQLSSQPGGSEYAGVDPLLGSLTILPMILINNPGRPDGGALARFGALAALFGINTVNPTTHVTGSGGTGLNPLGLHVGGANVLPVLVDATYEYQPLSDLASWPNAVTLLNNLAAGLSPTYMLRGLTLAGLDGQILSQVGTALGKVTSSNPLALNLYLTLESSTLPLLEPLYLASDALNLVGVKPLADLATHLANALAPALSTLVNIGYANTRLDPDTGLYVRNFDDAGTETPFLSFPDIDFGKALGTSFNQLIGGFQKEFFSGNPTASGPNVLGNLLNALLNGGLLSGGFTNTAGVGTGTGGTTANPLAGLGNLLNGLLGGLTPKTAATSLPALSKTSATSVPLANARLLSLSSAEEAETPVDGVTSGTGKSAKTDGSLETGTSQDAVEAPEPTAPVEAPESTAPLEAPGGETAPATSVPTTDAGGDETSATDPTPPKHAKADDASAPAAATGSKQPKHAKPDANDGTTPADGVQKAPKHAKPATGKVRDTINDISPRASKPGAGKDVKSVGADDKSTPDGAGSSSDKAA